MAREKLSRLQLLGQADSPLGILVSAVERHDILLGKLAHEVGLGNILYGIESPDTDVDTHAASASAHHVKYSDANALAAIAGAGLYTLIDGSVAFTGTIVGILPTLAAHLATKEYVDSAIHFIENYFFNNTASSYSGIYYKMLDTPTGEAESTLQSGSLGEGDNQALYNFATDAGAPGVTVLEGGVYTGHIHARVTLSNKRPTKIHFKVYFRDNGSETLVTTSEESAFLTNSATEYNLHATLAGDVTIATTDRLIIKWFANVDSTPSSDVIVELFAEGTNASRFEVPVTTDVLNQVFLRQDGTKAGSVSQAQDFGPTGIKADVIAESTGAAGVTPENVTIKDGSIELHHGIDTISSDEITAPTGGYIIAAAETGTTDDLDGIGGGANGRIIVVRADAGDVITIEHNNAGGGAGRKIFTVDNNSFDLVGGNDDSITLMYDEALDSGNGAWFETARGDILIAIATTFVTDSGNAVPNLNAIAILGGEGINTSGSAATVTIAGEDANVTNKGIVELATVAEIDAATPSRAITTDALGDSNYSERILGFLISDPGGDALTTGDTKALARIPSSMNGYELVEANACVTTVSSSGPVTIQVAKSSRTNATTRTASVNMLSTPITIDVSEFDSLDAAAEVIQTDGKEDVVTGDQIRIDIDAAGTGVKGLFVELIFRLK